MARSLAVRTRALRAWDRVLGWLFPGLHALSLDPRLLGPLGDERLETPGEHAQDSGQERRIGRREFIEVLPAERHQKAVLGALRALAALGIIHEGPGPERLAGPDGG